MDGMDMDQMGDQQVSDEPKVLEVMKDIKPDTVSITIIQVRMRELL